MDVSLSQKLRKLMEKTVKFYYFRRYACLSG